MAHHDQRTPDVDRHDVGAEDTATVARRENRSGFPGFVRFSVLMWAAVALVFVVGLTVILAMVM